MIRILSTKKLLPNQKQYLLNAGFNIVEADLISIEFNAFSTEGLKQNFIFTSTNAFNSFLANEESSKLGNRKIFCVGNKTRELIEQSGFVVEASADYAEELAKIITDQYSNHSFTFFSGSMRRDTLPIALTKAGVQFNEIKVYTTVLTPQEVKAALDGILFFSPSGIESYLDKNGITTETCFCIGTTTADTVKGISENVVIANKPSVENVIIQCINYYKKT